MLTDTQVRELATKMNVPLEDVIFKSDVPHKFEYNRSYIINLDDEYKDDGTLNCGSHYTCLQINKYPNNKIESIYFDPMGLAPPKSVLKCFKNTTGKEYMPNTNKNVQSILNNACGWYCLAFLHYINCFSHRTKNLYDDVDAFLSFFDDLNDSVNFKKNEYILKQFFQPQDPKLRKEIDVIGNC